MSGRYGRVVRQQVPVEGVVPGTLPRARCARGAVDDPDRTPASLCRALSLASLQTASPNFADVRIAQPSRRLVSDQQASGQLGLDPRCVCEREFPVPRLVSEREDRLEARLRYRPDRSGVGGLHAYVHRCGALLC
jgi:hypothetical protein